MFTTKKRNRNFFMIGEFNIIIVIYLLALLLQGFPAFSSENSLTDFAVFEGADGNWRIPRYCGPNALYAFLKLNGVEPSYDKVLFETSPKENGTSLEDLRRASNSLGVTSEICHLQPSQLCKIYNPVIAHMSGVKNGHFLVILGYSDSTLLVADPTACAIERLTIDQFKETWSGYILQKKTPFWLSSTFQLFILSGIILLLGLTLYPKVSLKEMLSNPKRVKRDS